MSRENRHWIDEFVLWKAVSIRSRLDEPGELDNLPCATKTPMFQSAPGSMSRENGLSRGCKMQYRCFNPLPAR